MTKKDITYLGLNGLIFPRVSLVLLVVLFTIPGIASAFQLTDQDGVVHRIAHPYSRIISLYPAHTENLLAMGAASKLIGISTSDSGTGFPKDKERFSYHDSAEKFIAARPDCILIRPMISNSKAALIEKLRKFGITIISLQPHSIAELHEYWRNLGRLSDCSDAAEEMITRFNEDLDRLKAKTANIDVNHRPKVYFESIHSRMKTFSPESIAIFCLTAAGGVNIARDAEPRRGTNIASYSKERILARAGETDVFLAQVGRMNPIDRNSIINEPGFGAIKAIRDDRILLIDEKLVSRPTVKLLEGIARIQAFLYPNSP